MRLNRCLLLLSRVGGGATSEKSASDMKNEFHFYFNVVRRHSTSRTERTKKKSSSPGELLFRFGYRLGLKKIDVIKNALITNSILEKLSRRLFFSLCDEHTNGADMKRMMLIYSSKNLKVFCIKSHGFSFYLISREPFDWHTDRYYNANSHRCGNWQQIILAHRVTNLMFH